MKKIFSFFAILALVLAPLSATPAFAVGTNGSFENQVVAGNFATLNTGDTTLTNWTIDSGSVDHIRDYWLASDGVQSLDMNGISAGSISQTLTTIPGATYNVAFDLSGNPENSGDSNLSSQSNKVLRASATGVASQDFTYDTSTKLNSLVDMKWEANVYSFTATTTNTTLTFASQIGGAFGPALDNVSITETLPVASCPVGTTQSTSYDTVVVNSSLPTNTPSNISLLNGQTYLLVSSGTWMNSLNAADTEYTSLDSWATHMDGYDVNPWFLGEGEFDLQINDTFVNWGSYDSGHNYSYLQNGTGAPINLGIFDGDSNTNSKNLGWYGDNSGNLTVKIYACMPNVKYVTGGGNFKVGKTTHWTFGGNVWTNTNGNPVGQFELSNHITNTKYHFNSFTGMTSSNDGKTVSFDASGTTQGKIKTPITGVHFVITDNGEPGKTDTITVSSGVSLDATPITGGNFQVLVQ